VDVVNDTMATGSMTVGDLVGAAVVRVAPWVTVREVARVLTNDDIGAVVVGDESTVIGVISERDITHAVAAGRDVDQLSADDIAHTNLIWCDVTATVAEVASEMMERWVRHVLVEDDGALGGIVSARDLLGVYASAEESFESPEGYE
jgi:signal-transduction protein with cAMP-binding, CBS, and nucleotidyltransferase domain